MKTLDSIFGNFDIDGVFDGLKKIEKTFFVDDSIFRPHYGLKDNGDGYVVTVKCDAERDNIHVKMDKETNMLQISVYENFDKTDAIVGCNYYGRFVMTVPKDCDLSGYEKKFDNENKTVTISFKKISKLSDDSELVATDSCDNTNKLDYRILYNNLLEKYDNDVNEIKKVNKSLQKENETLKEKINNIKKLF